VREQLIAGQFNSLKKKKSGRAQRREGVLWIDRS
jgi:hypothetical protein